ncbi:MAG: ATP-binding cassette domain-containing protein [Bacteroidia bacterium]
MKIILENIGKRFNKEWIFRKINYEFSMGNKYAVLGTNGSGKSTLLQIISGAMSATEGNITFGSGITFENIFQKVAFASPFLELPEEMTWREAVHFQGKFKEFVSDFSEEKIISLSGLESSADKEIRNFSSGMKQRARLSLALLSDAPLLLLDEPSTNLDENALKWYKNLMSEFAKEKLVIVCSNYNKAEYSFCNEEFEFGKNQINI